MTDPAIATAADYADALLTARRAKNLLVLIVLLMLLIQLAVFFTVKYTGIVYPMSGGSPATTPANAPAWHDVARYAVGASDFLGVACTILIALVLYLITQIMVVGRLIGVSRVIVGAHYPSDVAAGLLLGLWTAVATAFLFARRNWLFRLDARGWPLPKSMLPAR